MKERLVYIDQLKGFAILLVVMGHMYSQCFDNADAVYGIIYSFHMSLFFFLSGVVLNPNSFSFTDITSFCQKKVLGLILPFVFVGSMYVYYIGSNLSYEIHGMMKLGYWYLLVLLYMNILLVVYNKVSKSINKPSLVVDIILILIFWALLECARRYLIPDSWDSIFSYGQVCLFFVPFMLGVLFNKYKLAEKVFSKSAWFTFSLLFYVIIYFINHNIYNNYYSNLLTGISAIIFIGYLFYTALPKSNFVMDKLATIGQQSLYVYIFHFFFLQTAQMNSFGQYVRESGNYLLEFLVCIGLAIVVTILSIGVGFIIRQSKLLSLVLLGKTK